MEPTTKIILDHLNELEELAQCADKVANDRADDYSDNGIEVWMRYRSIAQTYRSAAYLLAEKLELLHRGEK